MSGKTESADQGWMQAGGRVEASILTNPKTYLDRIAYSYFGGYFESREDEFADFRKTMNQARMEVGYDMYLARMVLYGVIVGIVGLLLSFLLTFALYATGVLQSISVGIQLPSNIFQIVQDNLLIISTVIIGLPLATILMALTVGVMYFLPSIKAGERKRAIESKLPQSVTFMYALSRGGMNVLEVIEELADSEDVYGEVANEFDMILRDMDYFGNDLRIALRNASEMTPSSNMSSFLDDILSVIDSGGDITPFLLNKSEQYHEIRKQNQKGFLDTLALMSESYVTAFVAAPLFIIIITTIMSIMGGANMMQLYGIIYMVLPIATAGFAFVIRLLSQEGGGAATQLKIEKNVYSREDLEAAAEESNDDRFDQLVKAKKRQSLMFFLRNPLKIIRENPPYTLIFTVPLALLVMGYVVFSGIASLSIDAFMSQPWWNTTTMLVAPLLIITLPLSIFHELKHRREKKILKELPQILRKLESANDTGMTLNQSIGLISENSTGELSKELGHVYNQLQWNTDINLALREMSNRLKISRVSRVIKVVTKANESSGNLHGVLEVAARDVESEYKLDKERFQNMIIYTVIILISFLVFLFVIVILDKQFLSKMAEVGGSGGGSASKDSPSGINFGDVPIDTYRMVFFHAAIIQGFGSGLVAGQMGEDDLLSGLKYGIVMMMLALIIFAFL
ncbi:MAG: type II secretion system F family protein [Halobacteria archaeon]